MAQVLTSVEPESEKFALSPTADLDEIREFLRCESLERMQLCMRLQKQQELLEQLSDGFDNVSTTPLKDVGSMDRNEDPPLTLRMAGTCRKQLHVEVDALKRSVENLTQDVKELQESLDPVDGSRMEATNSLVLSRNDGKVQDDSPEDREGELDRSYKVAGSDAAEEFAEGVYEPALDLQWLDERFEELQRQCLSELSSLEERLMDDFGNLKGFVDAAIVAMVSRMSTLEIFVKGEGGLIEKLEELKQAAPEESVSPQRCIDLEDQLNEVNERLNGLEKRVTGLSERPSSVAFSPAPGCRSIKTRGMETADSVAEKHPEALSPQRVLSHGPVLLPQSVPLNPPGSLKVPAVAAPWGSPVQPIFRVGGASSSQLVTVLATPRASSPTREVHPNPALHPSAGGRPATPMRTFHGTVPVVRAPNSPVAPVVRF